MDFMTHLPRNFRGHDTIWVVVDRLTKSLSFLGDEPENVYGQIGSAVHQGNNEIAWGNVEYSFR